MLVSSRARRSARMVVWVAAAAVAVLVTLLIAPAANAQLAICSRVSPPPSYCNEELPDEPPPPAPTPAAAPTDLVMSANTPSSITLSWTDNATNETQFGVDKVVDGYWVPVVSHIPANPGTGRMSTTIGDLPSNTSYKFRVFVSPGFRSNGPTLEAATRPEAPRDVRAYASDTRINTRFTPPPSADRLIVNLRQDGSRWSRTDIIDARSSSYLFTDLQPSTQYCATITAEGPGGRSSAEPACLKTDPPPPPAPPPPPPATVTVPQTIGDTFLVAKSKLEALNLELGNVTVPPGAVYYGDLPVVEQTPQSGTNVPEGTTVDLRVDWKKAIGVSGVTLANWHQDRRSIRIYIWDGLQWSDSGDLAWGQSKTVTLVSGRVFTIVAVDRGLVGCVDGEPDDGRPDNVSCQRMAGTYLGGDGDPDHADVY